VSSLLRFLGLFTVTGAFSGMSPFAPGTAGSAAACVVVFFLPREGFLLTVAVLIVVCTVLSGLLGRFAEKALGRSDPGPFVLDEFAGLFVTVLHPASPDLVTLILAFLVFRVFDIVKPTPARQAERLPGGWGIVADDLVAGAYANLVLLALRTWVL